MISLEECARVARLNPREIVLGVAPTRRHTSLLASYLLNLPRGPVAVRQMIVDDLHGFVDLGALHLAADTFVVLRLFLTAYQEAARVERRVATEALCAILPETAGRVVPFRTADCRRNATFSEALAMTAG